MGYFMGFPFGEARRNQPVELKPANPLPANKMRGEVGDAGLDGYTVLSRANRITDERPPIGGAPEYWGPRQTDEQ
jgi:hypothetical protein